MNGKMSKVIRKSATLVAVRWLKAQMNPEEAEKVTLKNFKDYLPPDQYIYLQGSFRHSAYSMSWFEKKVKNFYKTYKPSLDRLFFLELEDIKQ